MFKPPQTPLWVDDTCPVNLMVFDDNTHCLYTGDCIVESLRSYSTSAYLTLKPSSLKVPRFKPVKYRSIRQTLSPAPNLDFIHPFTGKSVSLKVIDISGSGVRVEDHADSPVLLPGMFISDMRIEFFHDTCITCQSQVVYSNKISNGTGESIQAGIALLDIKYKDFIRLSSLLHQAEDSNAYVCRKIDTDALWEFFFETGFIYPGKYEHFQKKKKEIKQVYEKLYSKSPLIAGHFTYQDKGAILGHMSMLRLYDRSWMIHHHAARKTSLIKAGVAVLKQIGRFGYEGHRYQSIHMDHLFCYYRPDNVFPAFVFGGAVTAINDSRQCSEDTFAYMHVNGTGLQDTQSRLEWVLEDADPADLSVLEEHYDHESGGMMIQALDLHPEFSQENDLEKKYEKYGFSKKKEILSLKISGKLKAVILVNKTDTGLNMSDLTNSIKIMILDGNGLDKITLMSVAEHIAATFKTEEVPLLIHPVSYAETAGLEIEKKYNLWIMNIQYSDKYFAHIETLFKEHLSQEEG